MAAIFTLPAEMVGPIRDGLHTALGDAAQRIEDVSTKPERERHPEWYAEPREHYRSVCRLLDLIGWGGGGESSADAELDLRENAWALMAAVDAALVLAEEQWHERDRIDAERTERGEAPRGDAISEQFERLRELRWAVRLRVSGLVTRGKGEVAS
jgi:hypothetical protein